MANRRLIPKVNAKPLPDVRISVVLKPGVSIAAHDDVTAAERRASGKSDDRTSD
jgi:hypothetical protein